MSLTITKTRSLIGFFMVFEELTKFCSLSFEDAKSKVKGNTKNIES